VSQFAVAVGPKITNGRKGRGCATVDVIIGSPGIK